MEESLIIQPGLPMPANTAEGTLEPPRSISLVKPVQEITDGLPAEHIYIGDEASDSVGEPITVAKRFRIANWARGVCTELTFFEEGFLKVREFKRGKLHKNHLLELRFLSLEPSSSRIIALPLLWTALGLSSLAAAAWLISTLDSLGQYFYPASVLSATGATIALLLFVYRSCESFSFYTASGDAEVLTLRSNFGCLRRCRLLLPQITAAIREAVSADKLDEDTYLRAETQAHYRLRETGVITRKACSDGISLILSKFD